MKMETPKMDVVRFNESDVIVASGDQQLWTATVFNAGGTVKKDMGLLVVNPDNSSNSFSFTQLVSTENAQLLDNKYFYKDNSSTSLIKLVDDDKDDGKGELSGYNGTYTSTNGSHYYWSHQ